MAKGNLQRLGDSRKIMVTEKFHSVDRKCNRNGEGLTCALKLRVQVNK